MADEQTVKRCAILGTAPTWRETPWDDPTLEVWALNDSYLLGFPRADRWYDIHPFDKFYFRDPTKRKIMAEDVPAGTFVRPSGHIEWLAKQTCPVYVAKPDKRVPRAVAFPKAEIEARFGKWFDSTPAWMLAHALMEGYREIHIYGIHLATEAEYVAQKPNMLFLMGVAAGLGAKLIVPTASPLMRGSHQYAFEPDPKVPITAEQRHVARLKRTKREIEETLAHLKWWEPKGPTRDRLTWVSAKIADESCRFSR